MEICCARIIQNEKSALLPYLIATQFFFFWWIACLLSCHAISYKIFLSFESAGDASSIAIQLEAKVNEYLSLIMRLIFAFE